MKKHHRWLPWTILIFSELFFMAQASLQLNVGMFYESIQQEFQLSAFAVSLLGSVYYCMAYT